MTMLQKELNKILDDHKLWLKQRRGKQADLREADLSGANLSRADLSGADLRRASYSVLAVLQANWSIVSPTLATELMKWDAHATPSPSKFMEWKKGGDCPAQKHLRIFYFQESRELFKRGKPTMTLWELWKALAKENDIKI